MPPTGVPGGSLLGEMGIELGTSLERWEFWRKRLETSAESEALGEEVRALAKRAVERMREIAG